MKDRKVLIGVAVLLFFEAIHIAWADTPAPSLVRIKGGTDDTVIGNVSDSAKVSVTNSSLAVTGTFWQATQPVSGTVGRNWTLLNSTDSLTSYQGGTWSVGVNNFPSSFSVSNFPANQTVVQSLGSNLHVDVDNFPVTQPVSGSVSVSNFPGTQPISAASLPLPSNAAQETGGNLATIASNTTGVSTAANQATANTSLSTLVTNSAAYATGTVVNNTAITSTATSFSAPSNAIGFILEAESTNTANIRWAVGSAASTTVGTLAEPGRDTGFVPLNGTVSVAAASGTQTISIQWVSR